LIGTFPALNQRSTEGFVAWLDEIERRLEEAGNAATYGVNLIVHRSNPRLAADLEQVVRHRVPLVITSLGAVRDVVDAVHSYGGLVFHDVINRRHAEKAAEAGVDGIIAVSAGAGGHAGTWSPFALVSEIAPSSQARSCFRVP
jgi:nitronate monooxygenase